MNSKISPLYLMKLASNIERRLWDIAEIPKYRFVENYIEKWHIVQDDFGPRDYYENFSVHYKDDNSGNIDLNKTLNGMGSDLLLQIAYDIGVETPGYLPVVPEQFKVILKENNARAYTLFVDAMKNIYSNPADAVVDASSALDSLFKTILADKRFSSINAKKNEGLSKRFERIQLALKIDKKGGAPEEIYRICSKLDSIVKDVDNLRSDKTNTHGKLEDDYIIDDPLWAMLATNSAATIGIFIWDYYNRKFIDEDTKDDEAQESNLEPVPF